MMAGKWVEVIRLRFNGEHNKGHALDLLAFSKLANFQRMVSETAKALWKSSHPESGRLPNHFEDRLRLYLRRIDDGSAVAPLEAYVEEQPTGDLWGYEPEPEEIKEAIQVSYSVFQALEEDRPLPASFPSELVGEYAKWSKELSEDEDLEIQPIDENSKPITIKNEHAEKLAKIVIIAPPVFKPTTVIGEVTQADVRKQNCVLWIADKESINLSFTETQEEKITTALKDHKKVRLEVSGEADVTHGRLSAFRKVTDLQVVPIQATFFDKVQEPIEDVLKRIASEIPEGEWDKLPEDLNKNLDHYLYGLDKDE